MIRTFFSVTENGIALLCTCKFIWGFDDFGVEALCHMADQGPGFLSIRVMPSP